MHKKKTKQTKNNKRQQPPGKRPILVNPGENATVGQEGRTDSSQKEKQASHTESKTHQRVWRQVMVAGFSRHAAEVTALATVVYAVFASLQWIALNRSLELAHRSYSVEYRPWLVISDPGPVNAEPGAFKVTNIGRTPALNLRFTGKWMYPNPTYEPPNDFFATCECPELQGLTAIAPGESKWATFPGCQGCISRANDINSGRVKVFLFGNYLYEDALEAGRVHRTEICVYWKPADNSWSSCKTNNRME